MSYYNYHAKAKQLINEGHLIKAEIVPKWNSISPALVLFFDNHKPMPIRGYRWDEYWEYISERREMEETLKPWIGDGKDKEIKWKDIIGLGITELVMPWKDEEGIEFRYAMEIRTKNHVYLYNHYIDDDADTRADIALYFEHLAKIWKGEEQI